MIESADIVVIGAGLNGATTAYCLKAAGAGSVVLVDREDGLGGASGMAAGLLRVHYDNAPETLLAAASMPYFAGWSDWVGGDCGWRRTGFLRFVDPSEIERLRINVARQRDAGGRAEVLLPDEIRALSRHVALTGIGAAVYEPDSGTASNRRCVTTMIAACRRIGVDVRLGNAVTRLVADYGGVASVHTAEGPIHTRTAVLAAGAQAGQLAASIGVTVPVMTRALSMAEITLPPGLSDLVTYMDPITDSWVSPRADDRAVISVRDPANGAVVDPAGYRAAVDPALGPEAVARVAARVPALAGAAVRRMWLRADSFSPDRKPILGPVDGLPGLYLNLTGSGKGHKVAPAIGLALSELILTRHVRTAPIDAFALSRFDGAGFPASGTEYAAASIG